ncbi:DUF2730 family protein [Castellaniella caeni]|uniref:DUF2730 family protein n=1 Tax=Castellaniella caeni TaxID=266123 RepID=UPI000C9ED852|nr:DUF2730 family protein [Castellaniella caeni]
MNLQDIEISFGAMQWILTSAIGVYSWLIGRQAASAKELLDLRTRLTTLEAQVHGVPSKDELLSLAGDLKGVRAELHGMREALQANARSVERVNDYLLGNERRA